MKNNRTLRYLVKEDILQVAILLVLYGALIVFSKFTKANTVPAMDMMLFANYFGFSYNLSYNRYNQYITFGFSRRKFYREQIVNCIIRAVVLGVFRATIQWIYVLDYVKQYYWEGDGFMYQKVPYMELFLTNFCGFIIIQMILLISSTARIDFSIGNLVKGQSPQLKQRICQQKKKLGFFRGILVVFIKSIGFLMMILCVVFVFGYYQLQMTKPLLYRIEAIGIMGVVSVILYLIGKKRFRPEYI